MPTSVVHDPTPSFNPFYVHSNTSYSALLLPRHSNFPIAPLYTIAVAVLPLWNELPRSHQHFDNYLIHPTNSPKPHSLLSLHSSFNPSLNALLFNKSYPDLSSSPYTSISVSTPKSKHHPP